MGATARGAQPQARLVAFRGALFDSLPRSPSPFRPARRRRRAAGALPLGCASHAAPTTLLASSFSLFVRRFLSVFFFFFFGM